MKAKPKFESKVDLSKFKDFESPLDTVVKDPAYTYRETIFTYKEGVRRVKRFEKMGWEIVCNEASDGSERLEPVIIEKDVLHKAVLMRIPTTQHVKNQIEKQKQNKEKVEKSYRRVSNQGQNMTIQDHDLDMNSLQD